MSRIVIFIIVSLVIFSCKTSPSYQSFTGNTMGTTYHITVEEESIVDLHKEVDSILTNINLSVSTYIETSFISRINATEFSYQYSEKEDLYLYPIFLLAKEIYELSKGSYDPTIMPLVNYYGFGNQERNSIDISDTSVVDSLLTFIGLNKITLSKVEDTITVAKQHQGIQLDFSSIAKGYAVDVIGDYLSSVGINNYLVEIGGETKCSGVNSIEKSWSIGINTPDPAAPLNKYEVAIKLHNKALATSGNYRNFYEVNGKKYVHIIDPITGINRESDILSASIVADNCAYADGLATACIVMGLDRSLDVISQLEGVEACFIHDIDKDNQLNFQYTKGFKALINE